MRGLRFVACLIGALCSSPAPAAAFKFDSALTEGCHEKITVEAMSRAGWPDARQAPELAGDDAFIARDLPCNVRGSKSDPWILSLVIGVRWNDLHGHLATDLPALATVHGDPDNQHEHCLRGRHDDGAEGDMRALKNCERFIMEHVAAALSERDVVDLEVRTTAEVALIFQGTIDVPLQRYGFEMGRALHALQDSFAHALRSPDGTRVRHVLNFTDKAHDSDYREARDGHEHIEGLDLCTGTQERNKRRELAVAASGELLAALAQPGLDHAARHSAAQQVVARWLDYEPGCTMDNHYCDAPELSEPEAGCSVVAPGARQTLPLSAALLFTLAGLWVRRRRTRGLSAAYVVAVLSGLYTTHAHGQPAPSAPHTPQQTERTLQPTAAPERSPYSLTAFGAVSLDEAAFALRVGGRYRIDPRFEVGIQLESNPWFSLETMDVQPGVLSLFGTLSVNWLDLNGITLRSSVHVGATVLLFDLLGAPEGSLGPFVGLALLGVAWDLAPNLQILIEPAEVMMPIVQLEPVPFYYRQYRLAIGLQWNP